MKKLFQISVFALSALFVSGVLSSGVPYCPRPGEEGYDNVSLFSNPRSCCTYYECYNGSAVLQHCPEGLYFCPELQVCAWNWELGCSFDCVMDCDPNEGVTPDSYPCTKEPIYGGLMPYRLCEACVMQWFLAGIQDAHLGLRCIKI